jgi:uncharacterized membrane protein
MKTVFPCLLLILLLALTPDDHQATFLGTAAACVLVVISSLLRLHNWGAVYLLAGGTFYLVGTCLVTRACNVPKNAVLASVAPTNPNGTSLWASYLVTRTAWNHIRTAAALAAAASLTIGLCYWTATSHGLYQACEVE